jgi:hypothetical protein
MVQLHPAGLILQRKPRHGDVGVAQRTGPCVGLHPSLLRKRGSCTDRGQLICFRLRIPAGTAVRFDEGSARQAWWPWPASVHRVRIMAIDGKLIERKQALEKT